MRRLHSVEAYVIYGVLVRGKVDRDKLGYSSVFSVHQCGIRDGDGKEVLGISKSSTWRRDHDSEPGLVCMDKLSQDKWDSMLENECERLGIPLKIPRWYLVVSSLYLDKNDEFYD